MSLRILRRTSRNDADEMPFALALTLELTWLTFEQRAELEAYGTQIPTRAGNVVDISRTSPSVRYAIGSSSNGPPLLRRGGPGLPYSGLPWSAWRYCRFCSPRQTSRPESI